MPFSAEVLDQLLRDCKTPEQMFGSDGLLQQLTKALIERSLKGQLTHHLGYDTLLSQSRPSHPDLGALASAG